MAAPPGIEARIINVSAAGATVHELLSWHECEVADGFVSAPARKRYVAGRVLLRELLGELLGVSPAELRFEADPSGKLRLSGLWRGALEFSVTHSGELAAVAASRGRALGIDVEVIRPIRMVAEIAKRYLDPATAERIGRLHGSARDVAFLRSWTRLEAAAKVTGRGMSAILDLAREGIVEHDLEVTELSVPDGYVAALALASPVTASAP